MWLHQVGQEDRAANRLAELARQSRYASWRWQRASLARPLAIVALASLVAALRSVDRNLDLAVERGQPADLGIVPALAALVAAGAIAVVFLALRCPPRAREGGRYAVLWRLTCSAGALAAGARLLSLAWTLYERDVPTRYSAVTGLAVLAATIALVALWTVEGLSRGSGMARGDASRDETVRAARVVRVGLVVSAVFALLAVATPYASDQIGDLLLSWSDELLPSSASFGVAGVLLFGLVLQESGIELVARPGIGSPGGVRRRSPSARAVRVGAALAGLAVIALFVLPGELDAGSLLLLMPLGLLGLAEWAERQLPDVARPDPPSGATFLGVAMLPLVALAGGLANATVDALFLYGPDGDYLAGAILPAVALLLAVAALVLSTGRVRRARPDERAGPPWLASIATIAVVGVAWVLGSWQLAALLALLALLGYTAFVRSRRRLWALTFARAAGLAYVGTMLVEPIETGRGVGTIGEIGIVLAALLSVVHYLVRLFALVELPAGVQHLVPFRRVPIVTLLVAWIAVAYAAAADTRHDVRTDAAPPAGLRGVELDDAFAAWWAAQPESRSPSPPGTTVPLLLVAAEGGGIRASYWTAGVLDVLVAASDAGRREVDVPPAGTGCDAERDRQRTAGGRLFLISGASGGSVGGYAYARQLAEDGCLPAGWYRRWFARDLLGPTVGWGLAHDLVATAFHQRAGAGGGCRFDADAWLCSLLRDRGRLLEETLDEDPGRRALGLRDAAFASPWPVPHLLFNTAGDTLRERVAVSTLRLPERPGVVENALDERCADGDLPWVSGAVLSARFPIVTPTGRLPCAGRALVDGGYLENTGLAAIAEAMPALAAAVRRQNARNAEGGRAQIRIVVLEISNGPRGSRTPLRGGSTSGRVGEPRVGLFSLLGLPTYPTRLGRDELGRAARAACADGVPVALATVRPPLAAGWKASVGWRMSRAARDELEQALASVADPASALGVARALVTAPPPGAERCPWAP